MNKNVVSIVGRPNVGKSTLFNKIARRRISITEDTPGVTRDRIYASANWLNHYFSLIDTGGLDPRDDDSMMDHIRAQAEIAVDHADVIIFLLDGTTGVTAADRQIAQMLFKSGKDIILAVNKLDTKGVQGTEYEYYSLGLGEPFMISAENNLGLGDLLDKVISYFDEADTVDHDEDKIKVAFIGKPNVGKSSLINKLIGEERSIVSDTPGTTRDTIDSELEYDGQEYILLDTAGMRRKARIEENVERYSVVRTLAAIDRSDVCVAVVDAEEGITEQDSKIIGYAHDQGKALVLAINKWDLLEKDNHTIKKFENDVKRILPFIPYAPVIFVSAKTGQRLDQLLDYIKIVNDNYNMRISTGVLNDVINKAVLLNPPRSDKGRAGKVYYGSQVSVRPPTFIIYVNDKKLIHFSYVRYLENTIRMNFGFDGTPLRLILRERS